MPHLFRSASHKNRYYAWFEALHTRIDLLLLGSLTEVEFEAVEAAVRAELTAVEKMGNRFDPDSELSRAVHAANASLCSPVPPRSNASLCSSVPPRSNASPRSSAGRAPALGSVVGGLSADAVPVPVSPALFALLARCLQANRDTGGLFDITVNSPDFRPGLINRVKLSTEDACSLHFAPLPEWEGASIILDLSGILKGYALERLRALLPTFGIRDALINLGNSSILSLGKNPSDIPAGYCLTTSGNATADRRHIRNPLTGEFIIGKHTVSVTTANAIDGEIQSTVSFIQSVLNTHN